MEILFNKYVAICILFLFGNEIVSLMTLLILMSFFLYDLAKASIE